MILVCHAANVARPMRAIKPVPPDWRREGRRIASSEDDVLGAFVHFLTTTDTSNFRLAVQVAAASEFSLRANGEQKKGVILAHPTRCSEIPPSVSPK